MQQREVRDVISSAGMLAEGTCSNSSRHKYAIRSTVLARLLACSLACLLHGLLACVLAGKLKLARFLI